MMQSKYNYVDLFDGLAKGVIDNRGGFIINSLFDDKYNYVVFETISFAGVRNIYIEDGGVIFQTDGRKFISFMSLKNI